MKKTLLCLTMLAIVSSAHFAQAKTIEEYIIEAEDSQKSGKLEQAIITMDQAVKEFPKSSIAYTHLGNYISMQAQTTKDFAKMLKLIGSAFKMWDKAISLNPQDFETRFRRGAWAVSVPKFMGYLENGIKDLEFIVVGLEQSTDMDARAQLIPAYQYLATGYQKQGELIKTKSLYEKIIEMAPGTEYADNAQTNIDNIVLFEKWQAGLIKKPDNPIIKELKEKIEKEPDNTGLLIELGKTYFDAENYEEAEKILKKAISVDSSNVNAHKLLVYVLTEMSEKEYDQTIFMDTDFRTNLVFELTNVLDKVVALAPDDIEMRLHRGIAGVEMPFFAGKLDQGIKDLEMVIQSDAPEDMKAQSLYWLGRAHQKKAMTYWIKVVSDYSKSEASQFVFNELMPSVERIDPSQYKKPILVIDFILGFRDELAPQTAVWIEDKDGKFIKTIYVSGFSGYAKGKQINLPIWANVSKFVDVDGVTGASIDLGHHIYVWDLKDNSGKKVKSGEYIIKVEVSYWPSMKYQLASAKINLGKKDEQVVVEEGNLIPYLEAKYLH